MQENLWQFSSVNGGQWRWRDTEPLSMLHSLFPDRAKPHGSHFSWPSWKPPTFTCQGSHWINHFWFTYFHSFLLKIRSSLLNATCFSSWFLPIVQVFEQLGHFCYGLCSCFLWKEGSQVLCWAERYWAHLLCFGIFWAKCVCNFLDKPVRHLQPNSRHSIFGAAWPRRC